MKVLTKGELRDRIVELEKVVSRLRRERRQLRGQLKELRPESKKVKGAAVEASSKPGQVRRRRRRPGAWKAEAKRSILVQARWENDRLRDAQEGGNAPEFDRQRFADKHRHAMIVRGDCSLTLSPITGTRRDVLYPIMKSVFSLAARRTSLAVNAPRLGAAPVS